MAVRVRDIAEKLNISQATVSLVLNNRRGVSNETRERVLTEAAAMGYAKTPARNQNTVDTIQLLVFKQGATEGLDTSFFTKMMEGVDSRASASGYSLMVTYINAGEDIQQKLDTLKSSNAKGVILLATELSSAYIGQLLTIRLPMVVLDGYFEELPMDFVTINNVQGAFAATAYLAGSGHTKIGYLTSKVRTVNFQERHEGFNKALKKLGLEKHREFTFRLMPSIDGACHDMKQYIDKGAEMPTAFFADNDVLAAGAMRALKEKGYRIPQDISLVGFDDIPLCHLLDPELTTVSVPKERLGVLAVERLLNRIDGDISEHVKIEVGTTVVIRNSTRENPVAD